MKEIIYQIKKSDINSLGTVRCIDGLVAAIDENYIWIRGIKELNTIPNNLRHLPIQHTYLLDKNNHLFAQDYITPISILKELQWESVRNFVPIEVPIAAMPGKARRKIHIKLTPSSKSKPGAALITDLSHWKKYGETASLSRLRQLVFSVSENNDVLIMGQPLPPLPGKEYILEKNNLLPAGYEFEIPMVAFFVQERINPIQQNIILFSPEGSYQIIDKNSFVSAKRSAIRLTEGKTPKST